MKTEIIPRTLPERVQNIQKRKYMKRKLADSDNEHPNEDKRLKISSQDIIRLKHWKRLLAV